MLMVGLRRLSLASSSPRDESVRRRTSRLRQAYGAPGGLLDPPIISGYLLGSSARYSSRGGPKVCLAVSRQLLAVFRNHSEGCRKASLNQRRGVVDPYLLLSLL